METNKKKGREIVSVNCPVCYTGNSFQLEKLEQEYVCEDCGFILAENPASRIEDSGRCIFCGSNKFYLESPLILRFLESALVCYVCEAQYKYVEVNTPKEKYNEEVAKDIQKSAAATRLKERVEGYNQRAG